MDSGTLHAAPVGARGIPAPRRTPEYLPVPASTADEPVAVVVAGAATSGKSALVGALLDEAPTAIGVPGGSYVVIAYGQGQMSAHVPGCREPQAYRPEVGSGAALSRPPRRVELQLAHPLLRHFTLVEAPCVHHLGVAGGRILARAAERGGAVLFVVEADRPMARAELDLLAELGSRPIALIFAVIAGSGPASPDGHRAEVLARVPRLADAPWLWVDPAAGDIAAVRQALAQWADVEGLRRAGAGFADGDGPGGVVRIRPDAAESGWSAALDSWLRRTTRLVRQRVAVEVADAHQRAVQDIFSGAGCAGLPDTLDRELHALSLRATAEADLAVAAVLDDTLRRILPADATPDARRRVAAAVREGLADDPGAPELARVLLVTSTGGVASVPGQEALAALAAYPEAGPAILPPVGVALSGGCWSAWRNPANADVDRARAWLQRVTRAVESDLVAELGRRFEAVHHSLTGLVAESVDHGILLV